MYAKWGVVERRNTSRHVAGRTYNALWGGEHLYPLVRPPASRRVSQCDGFPCFDCQLIKCVGPARSRKFAQAHSCRPRWRVVHGFISRQYACNHWESKILGMPCPRACVTPLRSVLSRKCSADIQRATVVWLHHYDFFRRTGEPNTRPMCGNHFRVSRFFRASSAPLPSSLFPLRNVTSILLCSWFDIPRAPAANHALAHATPSTT